MMRSATDLSKADLHVFPKLFADGLERGQEAKAFSGRQIGGHDDVLDFFVGHLINVGMTRQPRRAIVVAAPFAVACGEGSLADAAQAVQRSDRDPPLVA